MKKIFLLIVVTLFVVSCTKSYMKTTIINSLSDKEIQDFPAVTIGDDEVYSGTEFYETIRDDVDYLLNKPSDRLSYNEKKAIELCSKITYQDCYDFSKDIAKCWLDASKKYPLEGEKEWENYELVRAEVVSKIKDKYPDFYFLTIEMDVLKYIVF